MGSQSLLYWGGGALSVRYNGVPEFTVFGGGGRSVRFSEGSLVLMAACSVRSDFFLYQVLSRWPTENYLLNNNRLILK